MKRYAIVEVPENQEVGRIAVCYQQVKNGGYLTE